MHPVYFLTSAFLLSCVNRSKWHHDSVSDKGRYTNAKANTPQKKSKMRTNLPLASLNGSLRHCPAVQNKSWACQDFAHLQMETNCKYNERQVHKYTKAQWWEVACKKIFNYFLQSKCVNENHYNIILKSEKRPKSWHVCIHQQNGWILKCMILWNDIIFTQKNTETVGFGAERAESTPIACVPLLKRLHNQAPEPCSPTRQGPEQASQF